MLYSPCQILLVEDDPKDIKTIQSMLNNARSAFFKRGFELTCVETLSAAKQTLIARKFNVILLDLILPDSRNMNSLQELQNTGSNIPIIVQTALEDEVVAVKAIELGACGYLPKIARDRDLLLYAIRSAIERKQQLANIEQSQQPELELDRVENILASIIELENDKSLKQRLPDIYSKIEQKYYLLLKRFVEQKIYKVEYELKDEINILIEQLGYLQATSKDLIELHSDTLKRKQASPYKKAIRAYTAEGRYLLIELMGRLVSYYRRYYIGLNKINLSQDLQNTT